MLAQAPIIQQAISAVALVRSKLVQSVMVRVFSGCVAVLRRLEGC
jgi:hypothetical protein